MIRVVILKEKLTSNENYLCKLHMLTIFTEYCYC